MKKTLAGLAIMAALPIFAQQKASVTIRPDDGKETISKHIYGQFAEHLGTCIYGGLWVACSDECLYQLTALFIISS